MVGMLTHVNESGLGRVVNGLTPRDVDDVSRHASCGDKATALEIFELRTVDRCSLLLLSSKMSPSGVGAVDNPISVDLHEIMVSPNVRIDERFISPGNT